MAQTEIDLSHPFRCYIDYTGNEHDGYWCTLRVWMPLMDTAGQMIDDMGSIVPSKHPKGGWHINWAKGKPFDGNKEYGTKEEAGMALFAIWQTPDRPTKRARKHKDN